MICISLFEIYTLLIILNGCDGLDLKNLGVPKNNSCSSAQKNSFFSGEDYIVILAVMLISCSIGVFYCICDKKQVTSNDFLLGGRKSNSFPMAMSLTSGFITAVELLGNPAEMYNFGIELWMSCISLLFVIPLTSYFFLPVFMDLRLTSCYEYLELRFHYSARTIASTLYIFQMILYTSVAVYAPALALSNVTGLNVYFAVSLIYLVCIFYASQGGMKAVIMTDTFQALILIGSILLILIMGNNLVGGVNVVFADNMKSGRLNFFNTGDAPARYGFLTVVIGGTFYWAAMYCSIQASIQKYLTVESLKEARRALWVSCFGLILTFSVNFYTGMILYSAFKNCDPIRSGEIFSTDQILPFFVMKAFSNFKGIPGLFVAGIFSASLGTVAAALNSLAAVSVKDFLCGSFGIKIPQEKEASFAKWISIIFGFISFGLVLLVEELGSVLQASLSFNGMIGGITLGMFSLGMFFPWSNTKGVIIGSITSLIVILWIGIGAQIAIMQGAFTPIRKETSITECSCFNSTISQSKTVEKSAEVFGLHKISFLWYSAISFTVTIVVGIFFSLITRSKKDCRLDLDLLSPPLRKIMKYHLAGSKKTVIYPFHDKVDEKITRIPSHLALGITNLALDLKSEKFADESFAPST